MSDAHSNINELRPDEVPEASRILPIIVGAGPGPELGDRPLGNALRDAIHQEIPSIIPGTDLHPLVMTDLWYLNDHALMLQPSMSIGSPASNAASAMLATRLPTALLVEGQYQVLMDQEGGIGHACFWGEHHEASVLATSTFIDRFLEPFLRNAAMRQA
ncbi:MAG: hypothetical protein CMJ36_01705 [Phycisphaerae bacterium]|nr:hypothetical protein [Phycisphaerae bacterium]